MRQQRTEDVRRGERRPFQSDVRVSWLSRSGEMTMIRAKCIDLSEQGARIECQQPIEPRTSVYLQAPRHGPMGNATVRFCRRKGMKHIVGLLFSAAAGEADSGRKQLIESELGAEK
ncbi:MAG TPA: PilZ domain-containing protein [Bryobacteraceae bacterium]|jgi:hypothetical protein|nr:PilZ domain-containing protein [Bryobacteraceae bacterium]